MACEATGTDVYPCNSANDFHTLTPKESISLNPRQSSAIVMNSNGDDTIAQAWHTYLATPGLVKLLGRRDGQTHLGEKLQLLEWKVWGVGKSSCRLFPENEAAKMNILAFRAFGSNRTAPIFSASMQSQRKKPEEFLSENQQRTPRCASTCGPCQRWRELMPHLLQAQGRKYAQRNHLLRSNLVLCLLRRASKISTEKPVVRPQQTTIRLNMPIVKT